MKKIVFSLFLISGLLISFSGCKFQSFDKDNETPQISMVYTDWSESIAMTYVAAHILEQELGYEVDMKLTGVDNIFSEIAAGEADLFVDVWLPSTHATYFEQYKDEIEDLGYNYLSAKTGLVVPEYMEVGSIADLSGSFDGVISGIDSTAGIMQNTQRVINTYNLNNALKVANEREMIADLEESYKRREDIIITGWEPHWIFYKYDLKYLEDPEGIFAETEQLHTIGKKGFSEEHPRATEFLKRMVFNEEQMSALLFEFRLTQDETQAVKNWVRDNQVIVNQWIRDLKPEREKVM